MAQYDLEVIKQIREETKAGVMDVRRALEEANGDVQKAKEIILQKGLAKAEKKSDREAKAGFVYAYIHGNHKVGVLLELNCETDFVAKTDEFGFLAKEIGMQIAAMTPKDVEELLEQPYIRDAKQTIKDLIGSVIGKIGENITLRRFVRYELGEIIDEIETED